MNKSNVDENQLRSFGIAALLPGMQRMIELMQRELDVMRSQLAGLQATPRKIAGKRSVGRPPVSLGGVAGSGWPSDPDERKLEAQRRMKVRAQNKATHPRDVNHPDHAAFVAKASAAAKARWGKMSVRARKERLALMAAAKVKKKKAKAPVVKLEVAS